MSGEHEWLLVVSDETLASANAEALLNKAISANNASRIIGLRRRTRTARPTWVQFKGTAVVFGRRLHRVDPILLQVKRFNGRPAPRNNMVVRCNGQPTPRGSCGGRRGPHVGHKVKVVRSPDGRFVSGFFCPEIPLVFIERQSLTRAFR